VSTLPPAVNFFLLKECNLRCRFCYSTFKDVDGRLSNDQTEQVVAQLADAGVEKITFVGGEPTLHPNIKDLVQLSHELGMVTTIVTNGARLQPLLDACADQLDWVGLSLDSLNEQVEVRLGRGEWGHVERMVKLAAKCRKAGVKVKLNSVITAFNWQEDFSDFIRVFRPDRWKAFQVLPVAGQNDGIDDLLITDEQFASWVARHTDLASIGLAPVAETNELMSYSYALIDPLGRFYSGGPAGHVYGPSILDVGVEEAWASVDFRQERFDRRGGKYDW